MSTHTVQTIQIQTTLEPHPNIHSSTLKAVHISKQTKISFPIGHGVHKVCHRTGIHVASTSVLSFVFILTELDRTVN